MPIYVARNSPPSLEHSGLGLGEISRDPDLDVIHRDWRCRPRDRRLFMDLVTPSDYEHASFTSHPKLRLVGRERRPDGVQPQSGRFAAHSAHGLE